MTLGALIKSRREILEMSMQDLADACDITKSHVFEIEKGTTVNIGLLTAIRLSLALGISINCLAASALEEK